VPNQGAMLVDITSRNQERDCRPETLITASPLPYFSFVLCHDIVRTDVVVDRPTPSISKKGRLLNLFLTVSRRGQARKE